MTKGDNSTEGGGIPEYPWMLAPAHLRTRRQLRAAGLGPNRQGIAALMVGRRRGRRLVAHLFDVRIAAPKRVPTPAQLAAITKATEEHQIKAAGRRGISRAELTAPGDPGSAWAAATTAMQGGKSMSDNVSAELAGISAEVRALHAAGQLDDGLADYITDVTASGPAPAVTATEPGQAPTVQGQRAAYLLALVGMHRARQLGADLDQAAADAAQNHPDAEAAQEYINSERAAAHERLRHFDWSSREAACAALSDAVVWSSDSGLAAQRLRELTDHYRESWGVLVDPAADRVSIDPEFDAETWQQHAEAISVYARQAAAVDMLSARALPGRVMEAVMAWHGQPPRPETAGMYLATEQARRGQLSTALAEAGVPGSIRAGVEFVVDYLRSDTSGVDLAQTPILVNPAEEVRGRVPGLLETFARNGATSAPLVAEEISPMTTDDQDTVREAGRAIAAGQQVDHHLWPGWVNRDELVERIADYARDAREFADYANLVADTLGAEGLDDDIQNTIADMHNDRVEIRAMLDGHGLHGIERAHLAAVVEDIDNGRMDDRTLPELLMVDERSKKTADRLRHGHTAHEISVRAAGVVTQILGPGVDMSHRSKTGPALDMVRNDIDILARGRHTPAQLTERRQRFDENMNTFGRALAAAGVDVPTRMKVRAAIDHGVREAAAHGRPRADRDQLWQQRIHSAADAAARQADADAQRQAAAAGRATPRERACTARPEPSAARPPAVSAPARARIRQLHQSEVGR